MPRTAPPAKQDNAPAPEQKPTTIAGLIGSWFTGSKAETPASPEKEQAAVRNANTDAKSKPVAPVRTATTTTTPKQREASPKPAEPAVRAPAPPAPTPTVQTAKAEPPQQPEIRTAYTTPPASNNGLLMGAQPVVPVGSFNSFR